MIDAWDKDLKRFVQLANESGVRMVMVGGGAVNFHGYQRHSADVDWWIDLSPENLERLLEVFQKMDYAIDEIPESVKKGEQNISLKFSPAGLYVELITQFSVNKTFDEAYEQAATTHINNEPVIRWRVLSYEDLITSKVKSSRPKDLLDVQELKRIHGK